MLVEATASTNELGTDAEFVRCWFDIYNDLSKLKLMT